MPGVPTSPITINGMPWDVYTKVLDGIFWNAARQTPTYIERCFNVQRVPRKKVEYRSFAGVPLASDWDPNGNPITSHVVNPRFKIELINTWYANAIDYTLEHKQFDQWQLMNEATAELGRSAARKKEYLGAAFLEGGFSAVWNTEEGKVLFAADHPLDPRVGGSYSNLVTGNLSVAKLQEAIALQESTPDDLGYPFGLQSRYLVVHKKKKMLAMEVLGQGIKYRTDAANYTPNVFEDWNITIVAHDWLTVSENAWFLFADRHGLVWNNVIDLNSHIFEDDRTHVTQRQVWFCCTRGARDWRGVLGSAGA